MTVAVTSADPVKLREPIAAGIAGKVTELVTVGASAFTLGGTTLLVSLGGALAVALLGMTI